MGKDILHRVGNGGHYGCETGSREVLPQVEIPEKWTQEPPCFAITIGVRLRSHTNKPEWLGLNRLLDKNTPLTVPSLDKMVAKLHTITLFMVIG